MKKRITFKKKPPNDYKSKGCMLICRGVEIRLCESKEAAKLAAARWNAKHRLGIKPMEEETCK